MDLTVEQLSAIQDALAVVAHFSPTAPFHFSGVPEGAEASYPILQRILQDPGVAIPEEALDALLAELE